MEAPSSRKRWEKLAEDFESKWQFPHAVGAMDGKHINIRAPPNSGSEYFNYKKQFSIVLLAIADSDAKFVAYDLGAAGSQSDGGVFKNGSLGQICKSQSFPTKSKLGQRITEVPFFLLGDEAFALDKNLMKPYPHRSVLSDEKVFNRPFSYSESKCGSNDISLQFVEFSNVHNCDRSSNATLSNLAYKIV